MSKISDELRKCADTYDDKAFLPKLNGKYHDLADRIDAEMVELPRDADGVPIHVCDTVYLDDGREADIYSIEFKNGETTILCSIPGRGYVYRLTNDLTHERPDSLERIADELDDWLICASNSHNFCQITDDSENALRDISDRIRKLAKEREHE